MLRNASLSSYDEMVERNLSTRATFLRSPKNPPPLPMSAPPSWLPPLSDLDHALVNHLLYNGNMPMGNPMDDTPDETLLTQVMNLIRQGANPNLVKPAQNWQPAQTPLQLIATLHHRPTVRRVSAFLLEAGANPNPPEGTDLSPVVQAVQANDWLLVRTLVHHGARLDHLVYGQSLLLWAVNDDNPRMVTWMTRHGATLNEDERPLLVQRPAALVGSQGPALLERAQLQHAFQSQDTALSAGPASRVRL